MFDDFACLHPFKEAANLLAAKQDWGQLYRQTALQENKVVSAACPSACLVVHLSLMLGCRSAYVPAACQGQLVNAAPAPPCISRQTWYTCFSVRPAQTACGVCVQGNKWRRGVCVCLCVCGEHPPLRIASSSMKQDIANTGCITMSHYI
jgi:hypothetical protein